MTCNCKDLEVRLEAIEEYHKSITELVDLLNDVKGALRLFIATGKAVKWLLGFLAAISGIAWVIKHFGQ